MATPSGVPPVDLGLDASLGIILFYYIFDLLEFGILTLDLAQEKIVPVEVALVVIAERHPALAPLHVLHDQVCPDVVAQRKVESPKRLGRLGLPQEILGRLQKPVDGNMGVGLGRDIDDVVDMRELPFPRPKRNAIRGTGRDRRPRRVHHRRRARHRGWRAGGSRRGVCEGGMLGRRAISINEQLSSYPGSRLAALGLRFAGGEGFECRVVRSGEEQDDGLRKQKRTSRRGGDG
jgi:hypothetical protein